jgi:hypothetical protein
MHSLRMFFVVGVILSACTSSSSPAGSACTSGAGKCVLGGATCAKQAATSAQDCNPPPENPGGAFCCLDLAQAGAGHDALAEADSSSTTLPACSWPASLDRPDVYTTECTATRTTGPYCVTLDGGGSQCGDGCKSDEYAVSCGGPGPAQPPPLPSGCRAILSGPGGNNAGCCPCGS